jgi:hypothetical protein
MNAKGININININGSEEQNKIHSYICYILYLYQHIKEAIMYTKKDNV